MDCPKCSFHQADQNTECPLCGIVFEKYLKLHETLSRINKSAAPTEEAGLLKTYFFFTKNNINPFALAGRGILLLGLTLWSFFFLTGSIAGNDSGKSFMHMINLPFHEAGHIIFMPLGKFFSSIGGTIVQLLIPLICLITFIVKTKDPFGASVALWWHGQNYLDIAPYINDARTLKLVLLGGYEGSFTPYGYHDWEYILTELGLLRYDHSIAMFSFIIGSVLMITAIAWGLYMLYLQYKSLR
ncbi:MAG: zinc ribbon domain-containing protein [Nitrospira sp.]|nr:zinc ribbon domain-containing protein [bacterium]MBL7049292.1 zinc ribbon domain-containing protein [Nitrospira sp.]